MTARLLVLDNYDSFTFNLVQMFRRYDLNVDVIRSDKITVSQIRESEVDYLVVSPGPKTPKSAGISVSCVATLKDELPILGVCLGMQCINEAFGGITVRAPVPVHGKTSTVQHRGQGLFQNVVNPLRVARYHSLAIDRLSPEIEVTAKAPDGVVMAIQHRTLPLHGVQFHPESFLTEHGFQLIENFLNEGPMQRPLARPHATTSFQERREA